jgi:SAM-dependent methyltransferase
MLSSKNNMRRKTSKLVILLIDRISSVILDNPYMFNYVRYLLAGKQKGMKSFISKYLNKYHCKTVADVCSGTGDFAAVIPPGALYLGWDKNEDFIAFAERRYKNDVNISFKKLDVLKAQKKVGKKYDAAMLISAVHHFSDKDLDTLLKFIKKRVNKILIIADIIPDPPHLLQRFFVKIDRGKFVRPAHEKVRILNNYFKVVYTEEIPTRSAVQFGMICIK